MKEKRTFCHNCGNNLKNDDLFCSECGVYINDSAEHIENSTINSKKNINGGLIVLLIIIGVIGLFFDYIFAIFITHSSDTQHESNETPITESNKNTGDKEKNDSTTDIIPKEPDKSYIIYNDNGILAKITDYKYNKISGKVILTVYMENNSDMNVTFSTDDMSIDGIMVDKGWFYQTVNAHTVATETFTIYNLEEKGINYVKTRNLNFYFKIYSADNFFDDILEKTLFTYTFN